MPAKGLAHRKMVSTSLCLVEHQQGATQLTQPGIAWPGSLQRCSILGKGAVLAGCLVGPTGRGWGPASCSAKPRAQRKNIWIPSGSPAFSLCLQSEVLAVWDGVPCRGSFCFKYEWGRTGGNDERHSKMITLIESYENGKQWQHAKQKTLSPRTSLVY